MFLSSNGDVEFSSLFIVLYDRFVRDDSLESIVLGWADIRI